MRTNWFESQALHIPMIFPTSPPTVGDSCDGRARDRFIFDGSTELFAHYDFSSGDHADLDTVIKVATSRN